MKGFSNIPSPFFLPKVCGSLISSTRSYAMRILPFSTKLKSYVSTRAPVKSLLTLAFLCSPSQYFQDQHINWIGLVQNEQNIGWSVSVILHWREEGCIGNYAPRGPRDLPKYWFCTPRPERLPEGEARGQSRGPRGAKSMLRQISRSEGGVISNGSRLSSV